MDSRPNLRFAYIVFGTALFYTVLSWLPGINVQNNLSLPLLFVSIALGLITTLALEDKHVNHH